MDAPTPFTAEEIRAGCPPGRTVTTQTTSKDGTTVSVTTFLEGNDVGAQCDFDGERGFVTWEGLRAHASFPADATTITEETITTALGTFDCLRYDVARESGIDRFWFAKNLPGMPIRIESEAGGLVVSTSTVTANGGR